ncbi:class I SAM-dependent methyltransferase [Ferruginibacter sp. SUN106]|uniref:class I SAM-dependent methyltransferase n=1 Tax=Ferruginibacter sp. SUN106 TaxID=2978348 RepID=UPI003D35E832
MEYAYKAGANVVTPLQLIVTLMRAPLAFYKIERMMDSYKETFETWNKVASLYQDKFMHLDLYNETYDFICDSIAVENAAILEIGCGPGNITTYLLHKRAGFNILGIDIAPNMIALAKKNNPAANFAVMDSRAIDQLTTTFDGIIIGFCLPYLAPADSEKLIADAHTLLNEDGFIYLSFVEGDPDKSGYQTASTGDRTYFYYYELDKLKEQFIANGFEILRLFNVEYERSATEKEIHTILTAKKKTV